MKIPILILALCLGVGITPVFSEEGKTIDLKEMAKMAQAMKSNESLISDPKAMAAMKQLVENIDKSPELKALMKNPQGLAAMMRLAGSFKVSQGINAE